MTALDFQMDSSLVQRPACRCYQRFVGWTCAILLLVHAASGVSWAQSVLREKQAVRKGSAQKAVPTAQAGKTDDMQAVDAAEAAKLGADWVRMQNNDKGEPIAMQTAIVRYAAAPKPGDKGKPAVTVDLIGAVHVADEAYYEKLNKRFEEYDALLYELVAPEGTVVERGRGTSNLHPIGAMQNGIKSFLNLDHQLEEIDYTKPNFVHADMTPDQFAQSMQDRNESFLQMYFRLLGQAMAQQGEMAAKGNSTDVDLFSALFASDRPRRLKIILGSQLSEVENLLASFGGEEGSVIISERNKIALKVLKEQLASGKKHVGVFYGAGHLVDMDQWLRKDFGLQPVAVTWLTAWDLAP
jgi:hypothetical protein